MIRYATSPIAWSNDDNPSIGAHISLEDCLSEAQRIGFEGIEKGNKFPEDPEQIRSKLAEYNLVFASGWHSLHLLDRSVEDEKKSIQPHLDKLKHNGCKVCIACETSNSVHGREDIGINDKPMLDNKDWPGFGAAVEAIAEYCFDQGILLAYHFHTGTIVETPEEIDRLLEHTGPHTYLTFDTGHCLVGGGDPALLLQKYAERIRHVHTKDVRPAIQKAMRARNLSFLDAVRSGLFTVPGDKEGVIDFAQCLQVLAHTGYQGWLVLEAEQDPSIHNPFTYQSLGLHTLKTLATQAGIPQTKPSDTLA